MATTTTKILNRTTVIMEVSEEEIIDALRKVYCGGDATAEINISMSRQGYCKGATIKSVTETEIETHD